MYPDFGLKDYSGDSFPGDHAAVLFTWLGYCLFFVRNKWTAWILFVVVLFVMPRLITNQSNQSVFTLKNHTFGIEKPQNNKKWNQICNANTQHRDW
jgi:hypothetical protein